MVAVVFVFKNGNTLGIFSSILVKKIMESMTNDAWLKCILAQAFENKTMCKIKKNSFLICVLLNNNTQ